MHEKNFVHRDIKPDNFLMGLGQQTPLCHIVDMGLAKYFIDPRTKKHMSKVSGKSLTGTARYVSVNSHKGLEVSRRDDLEAVGYVLVYLYTSSLPWIDLDYDSDDKQYRDIMDMKEGVSAQELCQWCPEEFCEFIEYSRDLHFDQKPDYAYLKGLFEQVA